MAEKSEEKNPFIRKSVSMPLVQSRKIARLIRDFALRNCQYIDNIEEKDFCVSILFMVVSDFLSCCSRPTCMSLLACAE